MNTLLQHLAQSSVRVPLPGLHTAVGSGDLIARLTQAVGIEPCTPCDQRRQWLNQHLQFGPSVQQAADSYNSGGLG